MKNALLLIDFQRDFLADEGHSRGDHRAGRGSEARRRLEKFGAVTE